MLYAVAEDTSGNYATSSITIDVDNTDTSTTDIVGYWPFDASTTDWTGADNRFAIGASAVNGGYWVGDIDDVRIYNRVLTAPEVLQLYDQGL
jgi:hypothetical protein